MMIPTWALVIIIILGILFFCVILIGIRRYWYLTKNSKSVKYDEGKILATLHGERDSFDSRDSFSGEPQRISFTNPKNEIFNQDEGKIQATLHGKRDSLDSRDSFSGGPQRISFTDPNHEILNHDEGKILKKLHGKSSSSLDLRNSFSDGGRKRRRIKKKY